MGLPPKKPTTGWDEHTFLGNYVSKLFSSIRNKGKIPSKTERGMNV